MASPLASLFEHTPELADAVLGLLPLRTLAVLLKTCKAMNTAVQRQPEHAWLARARTLPAGHPLLQAPCVRGFLRQQQQLHASLQCGRLTVSPLSVPHGMVSS